MAPERGGPKASLTSADLLPAPRSDAPDIEWAARAANELAEMRALVHPEVVEAAIEALRDALHHEAEMTSQLLASVRSGPGTLVGLEYRLKSPGSLARKIRTKALEKMLAPKQAADALNDTIRYTVTTVRQTDLIPTLVQTIGTLCANGWTMHEAEQSFEQGNPYKGIHLVLSGPDGHRCEVQFHTQAAFKVKQDGHADYETYRDPDQPGQKRQDAFDRSVKLWAPVPTPRGLRKLKELGGVQVFSRKYPPLNQSREDRR